MIGDNIKNFRTAAGLSQKDLAEKLFVTPQAVSRWEKGDVEPSIATLVSMSEIFGVSIDEICGKEIEKPEPEVIEETKYVYDEANKPLLAVCTKCNKPIYNPDEITRDYNNVVTCKECKENQKRAEKSTKEYDARKNRIRSFIWGGLAGGLWVVITIASVISDGDTSVILPNLLFALGLFTLVSCLFLQNNFIGEMISTICSWGFVSMPGVIFELSLDGILWLITVKLLLWILGIILAVICAAFGIVLGFVCSFFVYPFALIKNIKRPELTE